MNYEQYEKSLTALPQNTRDVKIPDGLPITEWIECPKSKAVIRFGYNPEQRILAVMWLNGTAEVYLYSNCSEYLFTDAKAAYSIGKYLKSNLKYKNFTKVPTTV